MNRIQATKTYETLVCSACGEPAELHWIDERNEAMRRRSLCFTCCFWAEKIDLALERPNDVARINGQHYVIEPDQDPRNHFLGFGGREHVIRFRDDGRVVTTHNLWMQGEIPERWRDRLPDNAEWVLPT